MPPRHNHISAVCALIVAAMPLLFVLSSANATVPAFRDSLVVENAQQLVRAVRAANRDGGDVKIVLADGTYSLEAGIVIRAPNIALIGKSGQPQTVVIEGDAMAADARVGNLITVMADSFLLDGITLQKARFHLIQVKGESGAENFTARNCVMRDSYQQLLKVTAGKGDKRRPSDNGLVQNCLFEYSAGIGPQYYIGGIDAHGARNWIVQDNTFRGIVSPGPSVAEYAIHFWNDSANNIVERNRIVNCDRGIGFGLGKRGNTRGIIRNNMIYHDADHGDYADVGVAIHNSPGTQIYNNTIVQLHKYPNAIEYRFPATRDVLIANNLTNRAIRALRDADASLYGNITDVKTDAFPNLDAADLHLGPEATDYIDKGTMTAGLIDDFDGQARPFGAGVDVGADEVPDVTGQTSRSDVPEL